MFKRNDSNIPLSVEVGGTTFRFSSPSDFEFAMSGRTSIPAAKITGLMQLPDDMLVKELEGIRKVERRLIDVLSRAVEGVSRVGPFLKEIDLSMISDDNNWRVIVAALNRLGPEYEDYKRSALVKYLQYLGSRQEVVRSFLAARQQNRPAPEVGVKGAGEAVSSGILKDTLTFDASSSALPSTEPGGLKRVPKGQSIDVRLEPQQSIDLRLGKHAFKIVSDGKLRFLDEQGNDFVLHIGTNVVGRDGRNDVVIDEDFHTVSRKHLIIQTEGSGLLRLTDVSSLGTFLPAKYLDDTAS